MKSKIDEVVTDNNLTSMAGNRSYMRGLEYFLNGAVKNFYCDGEQLTADVCGTQVYRARITNDNGRLNGECSCPVGRDGDFCKHLVALGLTYLYKQEEEQINLLLEGVPAEMRQGRTHQDHPGDVAKQCGSR